MLPAAAQAVDPRRGTALVLCYAAAAAFAVVAWGAWRGFTVDLSPLELTAFIALSASAGQISILVGPRTWYSPTTPVMALAALAGGPVAGALTGAASEALAVDRVWRHRLMGSSRSALEGFAAGAVGLLLPATGSPLVPAAAALAASFALAQVARALVVRVREIRPAAVALRAGALIDGVETVVAAPVVAALLSAEQQSAAIAVAAVAAVVAGLALAERAHRRQAEQLERERTAARTDALTNAPNRLALDEALVLEHARVLRGARPAGLFIVDVDRFKLANDTHGHDVGDAVLVETVDRLRAGLRDSDLVARWGGDELIVLARDMPDVAALEAYGERIRRMICERPYRLPNGDELPVTASVGGSLLDGGAAPEVVLKRADLAVYRAKQTRNASVVEVPSSPRRSLAAVGGSASAAF